MGNPVSKELILERKKAQQEARPKAHIAQNLVHEEFNTKIEEVYDLRNSTLLGKGGFGSVRAVAHRRTGKRFAVKTVELKDVAEAKDFSFILNEIELMKKLDHPNIARVQEVYHSPDRLHIVMDLYTGGDLFDRYAFRSEASTAALVGKIVNGVRYCHDQGVAHRDLKLENIMFESEEYVAEIKLVDFGLGSNAHEGLVRHDLVGSWIYMAPEVIRRAHGPKAADMWSVGVISYCLLAGYPPFRADTLKGLKHMILTADVEFEGPVWRNISDDAKDFIRRLLDKKDTSRMTAKEAQAHPWLSQGPAAAARSAPLDPAVLKSLKRFRHTTLMKKVALGVVARTLATDEMRALEDEFSKADVTQTGVITVDDFRTALRRQSKLGPGEVDAIFEGLDVDRTGRVNFTEFLAGCVDRRKLDEARLRYAFERLDYDHNGTIDAEDLQMVVGADMSQEEVKEALAVFDTDGDGRIGFSEFFQGMRNAQSVDPRTSTGFSIRRLSQIADADSVGANATLLSPMAAAAAEVAATVAPLADGASTVPPPPPPATSPPLPRAARLLFSHPLRRSSTPATTAAAATAVVATAAAAGAANATSEAPPASAEATGENGPAPGLAGTAAAGGGVLAACRRRSSAPTSASSLDAVRESSDEDSSAVAQSASGHAAENGAAAAAATAAATAAPAAAGSAGAAAGAKAAPPHEAGTQLPPPDVLVWGRKEKPSPAMSLVERALSFFKSQTKPTQKARGVDDERRQLSIFLSSDETADSSDLSTSRPGLEAAPPPFLEAPKAAA